MDAYVGIDLAIAKRKLLPVCLCTWEGDKLIPRQLTHRTVPKPPRGFGNALSIDSCTVLDFAKKTTQYLCDLQDHFEVKICKIGIDAPSAPRLEEINRREAEVALDDKGISCFTTPSHSEFVTIRQRVQAHLLAGGDESSLPHANQLWMLAGFAIFRELNVKWECLEVYPQATMQALNVANVHKKTPEGVLAQLKGISVRTNWPAAGEQNLLNQLKSAVRAPAHDALDAYASAWVAALPLSQREPLGCPPKDAIWVPRV